jgi:hypothetical protein
MRWPYFISSGGFGTIVAAAPPGMIGAATACCISVVS